VTFKPESTTPAQPTQSCPVGVRLPDWMQDFGISIVQGVLDHVRAENVDRNSSTRPQAMESRKPAPSGHEKGPHTHAAPMNFVMKLFSPPAIARLRMGVT
jgi:hypothetical protein